MHASTHRQPFTLVIHSGALGDTVLALPLLAAIKSIHPKRDLILIATHPVARLFPGRTAVDFAYIVSPEALTHPLITPAVFPCSVFELIPRANLLFVVTANPDLTFFQDLTPRTGVSLHHVHPWQPYPGLPGRAHLSDNHIDCLRSFGYSVPDATPPRITWRGNPRDPFQHAFAFLQPYVCIGPGASSRYKRWPLHNFCTLANLTGPYHIVWSFGPDDCQSRWQELKTLYDRHYTHGESLLCERDLARQACVIAGASAYVGNDSGPSHLAAALGTPTLVLFGPTPDAIYRPRGPNVWIQRAPPGRDGLPNLSVADVADQMDHILGDRYTAPFRSQD